MPVIVVEYAAPLQLGDQVFRHGGEAEFVFQREGQEIEPVRRTALVTVLQLVGDVSTEPIGNQ